MKTVILVWENTQNKCTDLFDFIKGTCYLFHLSKLIPFKLYIDIQFHILSNFLDITHPYIHFIIDNKQYINTIHDVEHYILSSDSNLLFFRSITYLHHNINDDCKQFIQKLLTPKYDLFVKINHIPVNKIVHVHINNPIISYPPFQQLFNIVYDKILPFLSPTTILLSDTKEFKEYVKTRNSCIIYDTRIGNIGYTPHDYTVEDSLLDLYMLTRSKCIYSFSWHDDIPGFLKILLIYNVNIEIIQH
jgi:hypothetical protein